jgi:acyl-CoA thioester hydrolase
MTPDHPPHLHPVRIYYEDTDAAGIVYYANYLRFIERARTEWLRDLGLDLPDLRARTGLLFVVRSVAADYLRPAVLDDLLSVRTALQGLGAARIDLLQDVLRDGQPLVKARVTLACIGAGGAPARIPAAWRARLGHPPAQA